MNAPTTLAERAAIRFYRLLLHLYPRGFLADWRHELVATFADRARDRRGPFGFVALVAEAIADVVPNALAAHRDLLRQDLRYAWRTLGRTPGFAITAILLVALGVGANTAAFSLADFVFVRPLPYPDADRIVKVFQTTPGYGRVELSPLHLRGWQPATRSFVAFGAYHASAVNLVGAAEPRRVQVARVTPEVMPLVGVPALIGRRIEAADSSDERIVVLSWALWQAYFGGGTDVIGRAVRLDGQPHTVVGVMPSTYRFPTREVEAWMPLRFEPNALIDRGNSYLAGIGRLAPGVTVERARDELSAIARQQAEADAVDEATGANVYRLRDEVGARSRAIVLALCGAALCILLLACANLASLLLARAAQRRQELAVRSALGAGRDRLVRLMATESVGLAVAGGVLGVGLAVAGAPVLALFVPIGLPVAERPTVDARVLAIALLAVATTAILFGVVPAVRAGAGQGNTFDALRAGARAGGGRTQRLRAGLVVVEVAASVVMLVASGLLMRAVLKLHAIDRGFDAERVLAVRTALPWPEYATVAKRDAFYSSVLRDVRAVPGAQHAAYATGVPLRMVGGIWPVELPGTRMPQDGSSRASLRFVTPGFFATLGIPVKRGRDVGDADVIDRPFVAVVSESFARRYWPGKDPIGQRFNIAFFDRTIVGVVGDVRVRGVEQPSEPQVYLPYQQVVDSSLIGYLPKELVVRSSLPPSALLPAIRRAVRAADPAQPISDVATLPEIVGEETAPRVTQLRLLGVLSAVALLIAGVGIHGLLTFMVTRRAHELAVRRALGASSRGIVGLVLGEGLALTLAGVVAGLLLAWPAARAMGALLAGVTPADPLTLGGVALLCLTTALVGCLRPALRALRVAPLAVLRAE